MRKEQDPSNEIMLKGLNFIPILISHTICLFLGGGGWGGFSDPLPHQVEAWMTVMSPMMTEKPLQPQHLTPNST